MNNKLLFLFIITCTLNISAQNIADFISVEPTIPGTNFIIPSSHVFQKIIEEGDSLTEGGTQAARIDFTAYVPISGSSENGLLSINSELDTGAVSILDIHLNQITKLWEITQSQALDFTGVAGTTRNCSGAITPWNTVISCEEMIDTMDINNDGHHDLGWCVEIDPFTKTVIDKIWALGKFRHENVAIHSNERTVYEGVDSNPGYLYKFVADNAQDLSSGIFYVYSGAKNGPGNWIQINNSTPEDQNTTLAQSADVGGTVFMGIEDVEIGPDGMVYFAVKDEDRVYRFQDSDPLTGTTVIQMETYVGHATYDITLQDTIVRANWGSGNDNLAFDGEGNLWVLQDGTFRYIWVVRNGHTQVDPKVEIFGRTPLGAEPTGITFSPDYRFLFMSIQHPHVNNASTTQMDIEDTPIAFDKSISLVIALKENLGAGAVFTPDFPVEEKITLHNNPSTGEFKLDLGQVHKEIEVTILRSTGQFVFTKKFTLVDNINIDLSNENSGLYFLNIKSRGKTIGTIKAIKK